MEPLEMRARKYDRLAELIDAGLEDIPGDFLKIYLLLLAVPDGEKAPAKEELALKAELSPVRVGKALAFWEEKGRITWQDGRVRFAERTLPGGTDPGSSMPRESSLPGPKEAADPKKQGSFLPGPKEAAAGQKKQGSSLPDPKETAADPKKYGDPMADQKKRDELRRRLSADQDFSDLVQEFYVHMNRNLTSTQFERLIYLYGELGLGYEVLHYLLELCVERSQRTGKKYFDGFRYFETVALDWHAHGVRTLEDAKRQGEVYTSEYYAILKEYGVSTADRTINSYQKEFMDRWLYDYGFSLDVIREAIRKTFRQTHSQGVNFAYTESILKGWKEAGVKSVSDIAPIEEAHRRERRFSESAQEQKPSQNRFHNFDERTYDYEAMMQQLRKDGPQP